MQITLAANAYNYHSRAMWILVQKCEVDNVPFSLCYMKLCY